MSQLLISLPCLNFFATLLVVIFDHLSAFIHLSQLSLIFLVYIDLNKHLFQMGSLTLIVLGPLMKTA